MRTQWAWSLLGVAAVVVGGLSACAEDQGDDLFQGDPSGSSSSSTSTSNTGNTPILTTGSTTTTSSTDTTGNTTGGTTSGSTSNTTAGESSQTDASVQPTGPESICEPREERFDSSSGADASLDEPREDPQGDAGMDAGSSSSGNDGAAPLEGLRVQYRLGGLDGQSIRAQVSVVNESGRDVALPDLELRYYLASSTPGNLVVEVDYAAPGAGGKGNITSSAGDDYIQIGFSEGDLERGQSTGEIQLRMHREDYSEINQCLDYSFDDLITTFEDYEYISLYYEGELVWGTPP